MASKKTLIRKNDTLFSRLVRSRGVCEASGKHIPCSGIETLQCAHGKSRRYKILRWDPMNAWSLCAAHHYYFHDNPDHFGEFIGKERSAYLNAKLTEARRLTVLDYQKTFEELKHLTGD